MKFFSWLWGGETKMASEATGGYDLLVDTLGGPKAASGMRVSPESSLALPTYFACIRNIAEDTAKLPLKVFRDGSDGRVEVLNSPIARLLSKPNSVQNGLQFREWLVGQVLGWGNGYAEIIRDSVGRPTGLWPVPAACVSVEWNKGRTAPIYKVRTVNGRILELERGDVLHVRGLGDELAGYSVARLGVESLGRSLAAQKFAGAFFGNGSRPSGMMKHPAMKEERLEKLQAKWQREYANPDNAGKTGWLPIGFDYQQLTVPPKEGQMLETMRFSVEDVCRWFRMPPHKVQDLSRATFSNIEQADIEYVTDTLHPWCRRIEAEIADKLLTAGTAIEHQLQGQMRGDSAARSAFYTSMFRIGAMSPNEIRRLENMPPREGGDEFFVPLELRGTDDGRELQQDTDAEPVA